MHPFLKLEKTTRKGINRAIDFYVEMVSQGFAIDDETIATRLSEEGFQCGMVRQVIRFVPIAFGRRMAMDLPVRFSTKFRQYDEFLREETEQELAEIECFVVALETSERYFENEKTWIVARAIGRRSSEYLWVKRMHAEQFSIEKMTKLEVPPPVVHVAQRSILPAYPALLQFEQKCHNWLSKWSDTAR